MTETSKKIRLLLVDDELEFLDATSKALSRRGFDVFRASEGKTALDLLGQGAFDVMVLDVKMPGIDGVEVFRHAKRLWPSLPVVLLTGHGTIQQAFETSREGVFEYLTKPCDVEEIAEVARRAVQGSQRPMEPALLGDTAEPAEEIRLLIVDDETDLLESLSRAFEKRGMRVVTASSGAAGLEALDRQVFDVVLLDIKMPGMDGIQVLKHIKLKQPLVEVIILTGHPSMGTAVEGLQEGAFDFLMKPQSVEVLTSKIQKAHNLRKLRQVNEDKKKVRSILDGSSD